MKKIFTIILFAAGTISFAHAQYNNQQGRIKLTDAAFVFIAAVFFARI